MSVIKAWYGEEPGTETQIGVDDKGRCFRRFRRRGESSYQWRPWKFYQHLDVENLPESIDGCQEITWRSGWRKWRFPAC